MSMVTKKNNVRKVKQACDECHKRRVKCEFDYVVKGCSSCHKLNIVCAFHRVPLKRGPNSGKTRENSIIFKENILRPTLQLSVQTPVSPRSSVDLCSESEEDYHDGGINMDKLLEVIDLYYQRQQQYDWFPLLPMDKIRLIKSIGNISEKSILVLLNSTLRQVVFQESNVTFQKQRLIMSVMSLQFQDLSSDEIIIMVSSLIMMNVIKFEKISFGLLVGIFNEVNERIHDVTIMHRFEFTLSIIDLLHSGSGKLCNYSTLGYVDKYFLDAGFSYAIIETLRFFEVLKELRHVESGKYGSVLGYYRGITGSQSIMSQFSKLIIQKYQLIDCLNEYNEQNKDVTTIVDQLNTILTTIKTLLHSTNDKEIRSQQKLYLKPILTETKFELDTLKQLPTFTLRGLLGINNNSEQILRVTQSMNDMVECTGLLGSLLGRLLPCITTITLTASELSVDCCPRSVAECLSQ